MEGVLNMKRLSLSMIVMISMMLSLIFAKNSLSNVNLSEEVLDEGDSCMALNTTAVY